MRNPDFFILGAPKCGTTALAQYLSDHPNVFMTDPKEPHHFNTDQNYGDYKDAEEYQQLFLDAGPSYECAGEASVWYLYSRVAVAKIEVEINAPKYIAMLRNPAEMAASLHEQLVYSGNEDITSFEEAWKAQDRRRNGRSIPRFATERDFLLYKEACSLGSQLERLFEQVDQHRILLIFNDEMRDDTRKIWQAVQDFLGVDDDGRTEFPSVNVAKERKSLLAKRVNDIYLRFRQTFRLPSLRTGFFDRMESWNVRQRPREPLRDAFRLELVEVFADEVAKLEALTGRDLSHWKK